MSKTPRQIEHRKKRRAQGWRDISVFLEPEYVAIIEGEKKRTGGTNVDVIRSALQHLKHKDTNDG